MCGLTGFLDFSRATPTESLAATCRRMTDALAHRGPDDQGVWTDASAGVALGHRRLSILDLSPLGHQPMVSESGRYVITYNGEIYNFEALRRELSDHHFRGRSDTEVILAAFERWGVVGALPKFNGMFALGLWDTHERALWLARDRFGEKPLYFGRVGQSLVFGSELKAIREYPGFTPEVDRAALAQFLRFGYVPGPSSIFRGIRKLPAASYLRIQSETDIDRNPTPYWSLEAVAHDAARARYTGSIEDATNELDRLLHEAIKLRMVSDVPLGAFLSGGIDSSTVVAMMQAAGGGRVRTFTIGFEEAAFNEADAAKAVAAHLGTDHTELYVTAAQALAVIPKLPTLYDEPFADSSQVPTYLVSQLARRHVTVSLSGDGGDELFGGYSRYFWAESIWAQLRKLPFAARRALASAIRLGRPASFDPYLATLDKFLPARLQQRNPGDKLQKLAEALSCRSADDLYFRLISTWKDPGSIVGATEPRHAILAAPPRLDDFTERMMCADTLTYLPDDILVKVDRAAMGVSLETRVPLLDPDIASFAWSLPKEFKIRDGKGKWVLREVLKRYVPPKLFERPKMGFGVPIDSWLRGPLREWAEEQLSATRLRNDGYFDPAPIREKWHEHLSGRRNWQYYLWPVLMYQAWCAQLGEPRPREAE